MGDAMWKRIKRFREAMKDDSRHITVAAQAEVVTVIYRS